MAIVDRRQPRPFTIQQWIPRAIETRQKERQSFERQIWGQNQTQGEFQSIQNGVVTVTTPNGSTLSSPSRRIVTNGEIRPGDKVIVTRARLGEPFIDSNVSF